MIPDKFYVTTPIYYVNDQPHIGHAYTTILADVLARYHRLRGVPTFFLTGTDEHGQKVKRAAERAGVSPQEQADRTVVRFTDLWQKLGITNDDFIRTTEPRHKEVVQDILQRLYDKGEIYKAEYDGWYCVPCERFFMDKDLAGDVCPECNRSVERITESNYFFTMSRYKEWLVRHINDHPDFIQPDFRRNETLGFLRKDLGDLCVSRPKSRLAWGIELPFDRDYVTYVWFDALVNYISAVGYLRDDKLFRRWWPASYHLIGKDILTTHTVYWPIMLKAMDAPLPRTVFAHGWWLVGQDKMSKSVGNVVDPMAVADKYGVDAFRYFLMAEMTPGQDAAFTEAAFIRRHNADLANDLGNLLNRVTRLVLSNFNGLMPASGDPGEEERQLRDVAAKAGGGMADSFGSLRINQGIEAVSGLVRETNRYMERRQPWVMAREGNQSELGTVLYHAAEALRIASGLLYPVMPGKMVELRLLLGIGNAVPDFDDLTQWGKLPAGSAVGKMQALFPRIDGTAAAMAGGSSTREAAAKTSGSKKMKPEIEYKDFEKIDLRTATIVSANRVEGADKLLCLQIRMGEETQQIVAGIAGQYEPASLSGRSIVVVANLKPARIRGVESKGMLLAASDGGQIRLITVDGDIPTGAQVK